MHRLFTVLSPGATMQEPTVQKIQRALSVPYHRGGPQTAFELGPTTVEGNTATSSMHLGPWARDPAQSGFHQGSAGVLIDDVTAYAALSARSADQWGVSSGIDVAFHSPIPDVARRLECTAAVDHRSRGWAHASGRVTAESGELVASVRQRFRYVPGTSAVHERESEQSVAPSWLTSLDSLLDEPRPTGDGVELRVRSHPGMLNPLGIFHGGISLCLSELAVRSAWAASPQHPDEPFHTASLHISYLRPGLPDGSPTLRVRFLHTSRSVVLAEVELRNSDGEVATHAVSTLHRTASTL